MAPISSGLIVPVGDAVRLSDEGEFGCLVDTSMIQRGCEGVVVGWAAECISELLCSLIYRKKVSGDGHPKNTRR